MRSLNFFSSPRRAFSGLLLLASLSGLTLLPQNASGQSAEDKAAAEKLYDEGKKLLGEKRYAEACTHFESSQRLDPGVGTLLFLGECYELSGRTASAWSTFREAAAAAKTAGRSDRERIARERAQKLENKLFQLTLSVAGAQVPGLKVVRGDTEVKKEVWGVAIPVDPGSTTLTVTAPGKKRWTAALDIPATAGARTVEIPALEDLPAEPVPTATASSTATAPTATAVSTAVPTATAPPSGWSTGRTVGLTLGIAGAVGVGIGAAFGGIAASQFSSAKTTCPAVACNDAAAVDLSKQAGTSADISTVLFAAGGAVLATGIVVFLISPSHSAPPTPAAWVTPMVGKGSASLGVGGRF